NRGLLRDRACVAWLSADVGTQLQRLEGCTDRPLLQVNGRKARLQELHARRQDLYQIVADLRVVTDGLSLDDVQEILESKIRQSGPPGGAMAGARATPSPSAAACPPAPPWGRADSTAAPRWPRTCVAATSCWPATATSRRCMPRAW